jgi:hypothetical protein
LPSEAGPGYLAPSSPRREFDDENPFELSIGELAPAMAAEIGDLRLFMILWIRVQSKKLWRHH